MAELKISIDALKNRTIENFVKDFASVESKMETGSCSAAVASISAAVLERAAAVSEGKSSNAERLEYIHRNAGIMRDYMIHLVDEDTKCRAPIIRAFKEGGQNEIDACLQSACAINAEIINMMLQNMQLAKELKGICCEESLHYIREAAEFALSAIRACRIWILDMIKVSSDETYSFVTNRENEVYLQQAVDLYEEIVS